MFTGPNIVKNGLVLWLDAANTKSYPGSGTIWRDLSGNGYNATLVNGTTFNSQNVGSMVFDGINDYVSFPNPLNQSQLAQVWTVQSWIRITTKPSQLYISGLANGLYIEFSQGNNSLLYLNSGIPNDYYTYGGQFTAQGWVLATFRFDNSNAARQIFRNLQIIGDANGPNVSSTPAVQQATFTLGSTSNTILGSVSNLLIYNRYVSYSEIAQNYNATKARYGL
jgi:hypothetical protein